jgi:hypothetical protein
MPQGKEIVPTELLKSTKHTTVTLYDEDGGKEVKITLEVEHHRITPTLGQELLLQKYQTMTPDLVEKAIKGELTELPKPTLVVHLARLLTYTDIADGGRLVEPTEQGLMGVHTNWLQAIYDEVTGTTVPQKKSLLISARGTQAAGGEEQGPVG